MIRVSKPSDNLLQVKESLLNSVLFSDVLITQTWVIWERWKGGKGAYHDDFGPEKRYQTPVVTTAPPSAARRRWRRAALAVELEGNASKFGVAGIDPGEECRCRNPEELGSCAKREDGCDGNTAGIGSND